MEVIDRLDEVWGLTSSLLLYYSGHALLARKQWGEGKLKLQHILCILNHTHNLMRSTLYVHSIWAHYKTVSAISYTVCKEKQLHYPRKVTKSTNKGPKFDCKYVHCHDSTWPPSHRIDLKPRASFREGGRGVKSDIHPPCQNLTLSDAPQTFSLSAFIPSWLNESLKT